MIPQPDPPSARQKDKDDGAALLPADPISEVTTEALPNREGTEPRLIVATVCGGQQARICRVTGKEHDMSAVVRFKDGGSVACKDCGVMAMSLDLLELP